MRNIATRFGIAASIVVIASLGIPLASSTHAAGKASAKSAKADIVETAMNAGNFSILVAALQSAGLKETLQGEGPFTVFAPTDEAFQKLPAGTLENLLKPENKQQLVDILTYHVLSGKILSKSLSGKTGTPATVQGSTLAIDGTNGGVKADNANVIGADVMAKNGVIHVVDAVLIPSSVAAALNAPAPAAGGPATPATGSAPTAPPTAPADEKPPTPK
jgi:uncharacterized surface protein with fasciclin (FAS1) repeats